MEGPKRLRSAKEIALEKATQLQEDGLPEIVESTVKSSPEPGAQQENSSEKAEERMNEEVVPLKPVVNEAPITQKEAEELLAELTNSSASSPEKAKEGKEKGAPPEASKQKRELAQVEKEIRELERQAKEIKNPADKELVLRQIAELDKKRFWMKSGQKVPSQNGSAEAEVEKPDTPAEWRQKLGALIGRFGGAKEGKKEKSEMSEKAAKLSGQLHKRKTEQNLKAEGYGSNMGKFIRSVGEKYNKLNWKYKLVVGLGLGGGAVAFSGVSAGLALTFGGLIGFQRALGMTGMFVKFEKHLQNVAEGKSEGLFGGRLFKKEGRYQKTIQKMELSEKGQRNLAIAMATMYTVGMSAGIHEAVHLASESSYGEAVHEWLKHHWPFSHAAVVAPEATTGVPHDAAANDRLWEQLHNPPQHPVPPPYAGMHSVGEAAAPAVPAEMPSISVDAAHGHGYEYMMKRLWEKVHDPVRFTPPEHLDPNSDLAKLLNASPQDIDKVVHQIAADPNHAFFHNADGTSVRIDPSAHMTIGSDGAIRLGELHNLDTVHSAPDLHTTPAYHHGGNHVPSKVKVPIAQVGRAMHDSGQAPAVTIEHAAHHISTNKWGILIDHDKAGVYVESRGAAPLVSGTEGPQIPIPVSESTDRLFVYGGSPTEQAQTILKYLSAHPDKTIYAASSDGKYTVPWHLVGGKMASEPPARAGGVFGLWTSPEPAPSPDDLGKIVGITPAAHLHTVAPAAEAHVPPPAPSADHLPPTRTSVAEAPPVQPAPEHVSAQPAVEVHHDAVPTSAEKIVQSSPAEGIPVTSFKVDDAALKDVRFTIFADSTGNVHFHHEGMMDGSLAPSAKAAQGHFAENWRSMLHDKGLDTQHILSEKKNLDIQAMELEVWERTLKHLQAGSPEAGAVQGNIRAIIEKAVKEYGGPIFKDQVKDFGP